MKLNRTGNPLDRETRNKDNENWEIIEDGFKDVGNDISRIDGRVDGFVEEVSNEALGKVVDNAKLNWKEPVNSFNNLPSGAQKGDTRMAKDTGKVYRFDGSIWVEIQQIDAGPVNELDNRLTTQLAHNEDKSFYQSLINHKSRKPMITWVDDDGHKGFYTKLRPLALEYGISFTSAIMTGRAHGFPGDNRPADSRRITYEQMLEMQNEGTGEFVSHSHNHDSLPDLSTDELREDFKESKELMRSLGFNSDVLVYPFGHSNSRVRDVAREFFEIAFTDNGGTGIIPFNQYNYPREYVERDINDVFREIDKAFETNGWLVVLSHVDQGDWYSDSRVRQIIEYAQNKGVEFVTLEEGLRHHGNLAQFGGNTISSDGTIHGRNLGVVRFETPYEYEENAPITDFPKDRITEIKVRRYQASLYDLHRLFGTDVYGNITVYRDGEDDFSYQKFTSKGGEYVAYRYWDVENEEWEDWNYGGYFVHYREKGNLPIYDYPTDKVSVVKVTRYDAQYLGLPSDTGIDGIYGKIYVYRDWEDEYSYQKFVSGDGSIELNRGWDTVNEKWTRWDYPNATIRGNERYTENAPITDFPVEKTTKVKIRDNQAQYYGGLSLGGILYVYRDFEDEYSYRKYVSREGDVKYGYWDVGNNKWSAWKES